MIVDGVKQFAQSALQKVSGFLTECSPIDLVIVGVIALIPVLAIVLLIANASHKKKQVARFNGAHPVKKSQKSKKQTGYVGGGRSGRREFQVRYVHTLAPKETRKHRSNGDHSGRRADGAALLATGVFGVGLGMMIYRAAQEEMFN